MEKKYDHLRAEKNAQVLWEQQQTYSAGNNPGPLYSIDTPPPTVSGSLHIGHIFSYTQTDFIARYQRMQGFSVYYPFGFDDNGLPTERFVEKKREVIAHQMTRSAFIELCLQETVAIEEQFKNLWQQMGLSVDWNACYSTIEERTRKISQASFIDLYKKNYVYRKDEPALYCTACRTSVAQAELDDVEKPGTFNTILFKSDTGEDLTIATTRPELLPSCVALLYNPADTRYQHLKNHSAIVPLFGNSVPILEDNSVLIEKGTGLVMVCTFGDKTDIEWFKKFNLPYQPSIGLDGRWLPRTGMLAGLKVAPAREKIVAAVQEAGLLVEQKPIQHAVNIHERCKNAIEYLMLPQWFLKILPYKEKFLEQGEKIAWYPSFMKARYKNWVENISWDWCLSRQRFFGISFPVWYCADCATIVLAREEDLPVDPQEQPYTGTCPQCAGKNFIPDKDVMDTWNTSSLTPYIVQELYKNTYNKNTSDFLPMSMRPQAHDIIRTWAFYTIVKAWMLSGTIPWKSIVISGHVLTSEKEKISKSQANSPLVPENLLKLYPADVIRYWTASGSLGHDVSFSDNQLKIGQRLLIKLWNAFKFIHEHTENQVLTSHAENSVINQWILHQASNCFTQYTHYFEQHEFGLALDVVEKFFWNDICDNYIELVKDQLFNPTAYAEHEVAATRATLHAVGLRVLQLYAPYLPHITETLYALIYNKTGSLHQTKFAQVQLEYKAPQSAEIINKVLDVVTQVRKFKSDHQLSLKVDIATLTLSAAPEILEVLKTQEALLKGVTRALEIIYTRDENISHMEQRDNSWHAVICV